MKILLVNSVCGIRSTGRIVTDLAEKYMAEGHTCRIAYGRETAPEKYENISYRIGTAFGVKINALQARLFDSEAFHAKRATKQFLLWADRYDPDLLWLHNLHGYYLNIEMLFDWIKSRPQMEVRFTLHDGWVFTGHCACFSFAKCEKWKDHCTKCPQKREYPKSLFFDRSESNFTRKRSALCGVSNMTLYTPSYWLAERAKESFLKDYPVKVVRNTIDHDVFRPTPGDFREKHHLTDKTVLLGVASAWSAAKGLYDFIKLSQLLDRSYRMVLVGLTKKQIKKMPENILCIQRTDSKKALAEIYTAADVYLNLTYDDNYPTTNLEAQACGTPCITYDTGGSVESVPPDHVVPQGDLSALLSKITELRTGRS